MSSIHLIVGVRNLIDSSFIMMCTQHATTTAGEICTIQVHPVLHSLLVMSCDYSDVVDVINTNTCGMGHVVGLHVIGKRIDRWMVRFDCIK